MTARSIKELEDGVDARLGRIENLLAALAPGQKMPVATPRTHVEAEDQEDPHRSGTIDLDGPAIERPRLIDIESPTFKAHAEEMAFMEESVTIDVHPAGNREKPIPFPVYCNGKMVAFTPGNQYTIPRKFVGVLIAARPVHYDNVEYERDGVKGVDHPFWRGPRFPFSMVQDTAKGMDWFRRALAAP